VVGEGWHREVSPYPDQLSKGWISDPRQTIGLFVGPCPETDPRASRADRHRWVESDPCAAACRMTLCAEADDHSWGERIAALGPKGPFLVNAVGEPVGRKQKITAESSRADVRPLYSWVEEDLGCPFSQSNASWWRSSPRSPATAAAPDFWTAG
jgi:hypothetical protein